MPTELRAAWTKMRDTHSALASPYFHPAYTEAVARACAMPVTLLLDAPGKDGAPSAILPLQGQRSARPVGAPMSDYHGAITAPGCDPYDPLPLLRSARIGTLPVMGWVGGDPETPPSVSSALHTAPICRIDLTGGFDTWRSSRDSSYSRHAKSHRRRVRKATSDIGEPRTVWQSRDVDAFDTLIRWKREQFATTAKFDVLSGWPLALLRDLWERGGDTSPGHLRADLQALYFGDRLAALDLGLSDGHTFHSWIVAYDAALAPYAPGIQLLEALIPASPSLGYTTLDLGVGLDGYKRHYANVEASVGVGTFRTSGPRAALSATYASLEARAEPLARLRRRYTQIAAVEPRPTARLRALTDTIIKQPRTS